MYSEKFIKTFSTKGLESFKYIKNIAEGEGTILLYGAIGNTYDKKGNIVEYGINGSQFANEILYLERVCEKITVRINSVGGSVLDGYSIASAIYNCQKPINTVIDGMAASTALWCAAAGNVGNRVAKDYSTGMIHESSGAQSDQVQGVIDLTINTMLSNRSNKKPEEIKAMMQKETWLNAKELLAAGFIDEVENTNKKVKIKKTDSIYNLQSIYNRLLNNDNMSKINTLLKINNNAEEPEQEAAIVALHKTASDKDLEITELKNKLKKIEEDQAAKELAAKEALKTRATELANKLKNEGKIAEAEVAGVIENASASESQYAFVSNLLSKVGGTKESKKPFDFTKVSNAAGGAEDRSSWSFTDWSRKDDKGLLKMKNEAPDQFQALYDKEFKK